MVETVSRQRCFEGMQGFYRHWSEATQCTMSVAVYEPPHALDGEKTPVLTYLAGLTCTPETFTIKAGAQRVAAKLGITLVMPDTSPRGAGLPGEDDAYDFGTGAGFYLDATQEPWSRHYNMASYLTRDLQDVIAANFSVDTARQGIFGHSMGGHGALTMAMALPGRFRSVSAFAPICNPTQSDWGRKQFTAYWGDEANWGLHDATLLMQKTGFDGPMLIDTGTNDQFWDLLGTEAFAAAMTAKRQEGLLRLQKGYDHSYFFISTFMEDHVNFHAEALWA